MNTLLHTTRAYNVRNGSIAPTHGDTLSLPRAGQHVPAMKRQPAVTAGPQPHTTGLDETFAPDGKGKGYLMQ